MIGRTNAGSGTGGLLINVVGGLSQPENPTYGTVWLETEVPINGWEILSVAPDWEAAEGHVYLQDAPSTSVDTPNFSVIDAAKKPYGAIWERLIGAFQRINGEWVRLNGAMWRDGVWTPFFGATINITYPAGSTCTATDGITTLAAPDTAGVWACVVPNAGTWTVANDKNGLSDTVIVSENAQSIDVDIAKLYLYRSGNEFTGVTGGWVSKRNCNLTKNNNNLYASATTKYDAYRGLFSPANKIDLTSFTQINYQVKSCNTDSYCGIVLLSSIPESGVDPMENKLAHVSFKANMTITSSIDISKLSGECYVCGFVTKGSSDTGYITVYQIDLE